LQIAAEKKARAEALKARQDKMLKAIADKKELASKTKNDAEARAKKLQDAAR
jgi:hypothetical protein